MPEMKITLPGQETVTLTGQTIDKLVREGNGEAALLYLYIMKTNGQSTSGDTALALGKNAGEIATSMAVLSRLGLVKLGDTTDVPPPSLEIEPDEPGYEPRRYTLDEIKNELKQGSDFAFVVEETQRCLGKILNPDELLRLFGIYDALRLPPEVILLLITHCISESRHTGGGRAPSMRYIEKAAYTWEREGIFSLDRAEEFIKALETRRSLRGEIRQAMQIRDREFSATEKRYVDGWIEMGFDVGAIGIAYDKTVVKTGQLTWNYMDSILKRWHSKGLHTPKEIREKDPWTGKGSANTPSKTGDGKFGVSGHEEIERMERLLKKIKDQ